MNNTTIQNCGVGKTLMPLKEVWFINVIYFCDLVLKKKFKTVVLLKISVENIKLFLGFFDQ